MSEEQLDFAVVNLSAENITHIHKLVLYKGLNYAIQPAEFSRKNVFEGMARLKYRVIKEAGSSSNQAKAFCDSVATAARKIILTRGSTNVSSNEAKCVDELGTMNKVDIKLAGKGQAVGVWDRDMYINEMEGQLPDFTTYWEFPYDMTQIYEKVISTKLDELKSNGLLSDVVVRTGMMSALECSTKPDQLFLNVAQRLRR